MSTDLRFLRAVERGLLAGYNWVPYSDELPEAASVERWADSKRDIEDALRMTRDALRIEEKRVLDEAERAA